MSVLEITLYVIGCIVFLVLTQSIHIFPGALLSIFNRSIRDPKTLPRNVESIFVTTDDGKRIEIWRLPASEDVKPMNYVGLVFHGNGASLKDFLLLQIWFRDLGITSYGFDYRGFGKSSGWPSEKGIYQDSEAFWRHVIHREKVDPSSIIILGFSVGSAPAARIASKYNPRLLILVSAFQSLRQTVREHPLFGWLAPFIWYKLPTIEYVRHLKTTDLILAHGEKDKIVRPHHSAKLKESYQGIGHVERITSSSTGHNFVFYDLRSELARLTCQFLERRTL